MPSETLTHVPLTISRRRFLHGSTATVVAAAGGCKSESTPQVNPSALRLDVPLRMTLATTGSVESNSLEETIKRGWSAVSEQVIDIQWIKFERSGLAAQTDEIIDAVQKSDLVIYPLCLVAQLATSELITPLSASQFEQLQQTSGDLLPALRNGGAKFGGKFYAQPISARLPAVVSIEPVTPMRMWKEYDQLVEQQWQGAAGEPSSPGWAGMMYLWRASSEIRWLFGRNDMSPLLATEPYIETLQTMVLTHSRYRNGRQTPEQIWDGIASRDLQGGITFGSGQSVEDLHFTAPPPGPDASRVLLDPFSSIISLSANCRQSAAAKLFINWIIGGDGSDTVRSAFNGTSTIREAPLELTSGLSAADESDDYGRWLTDRLRRPDTIPTLQLIRAGDYYSVLDHQVGLALDGEVSPTEALEKTALEWHRLTLDVGVKKQERAWRRAQGLRA